jgi:hypothetical protein
MDSIHLITQTELVGDQFLANLISILIIIM